MTEPTAAPGPGSGYQWRIVIDGDPGRRPPHIGCWIDVVDGDFQNLNVVGRLEFRAKPCATSRRPTFAPRNEDAGGPPGVIDLPTVRALIERAREDTLDGLTAREQLADAAVQMAAEIQTARAVRAMPRSIEPLIDKERHSPARVRAYLAANGWALFKEYEDCSEWTKPDVKRPRWIGEDGIVMILDSTQFSDYAHHLAMTVGVLAQAHFTGELGVLAGIEAACRPVTLDSGETVPVLGDRPLPPEGVAALKELIEAARARLAAENPPDPGAQSLWARVDARAYLAGVSVRDAAKQAGVAPSVLSRLANGRMPGPDDLARIEAWLARHEEADHA